MVKYKYMESSNKEEFIKIFKQNVKREGADALLNWLMSSDFFSAPASSKFHSAYEGGLCDHSLNVYKRFIKNLQTEYGDNWQEQISLESATLISLFHDVCKTNFYKTEMRNVKVNGEWVQQPYFTVHDTLPYGHGEKSVYILSGFLKLSRLEAMCINWHMGGFDTRVMGGSYGIADAYYAYPACVLFHISDLEATYLDEKR